VSARVKEMVSAIERSRQELNGRPLDELATGLVSTLRYPAWVRRDQRHQRGGPLSSAREWSSTSRMTRAKVEI
jgi:hypothetical protein